MSIWATLTLTKKVHQAFTIKYLSKVKLHDDLDVSNDTMESVVEFFWGKYID